MTARPYHSLILRFSVCTTSNTREPNISAQPIMNGHTAGVSFFAILTADREALHWSKATETICWFLSNMSLNQCVKLHLSTWGGFYRLIREALLFSFAVTICVTRLQLWQQTSESELDGMWHAWRWLCLCEHDHVYCQQKHTFAV